MAQYQKFVVSFVKNHQQTISKLPNAFFSVCMAAHDKTQAGQQEVQQYLNRFIQKTGWTPQHTVSVAGAILYKQYNFLIRLIMKLIAKQKQLSTDTSRNHEYTDWDQVKQFAEDFTERYLSG
jgi:menaquinone-dependent protoporphyrinogen oxidase